ncbi:hypothetical protein PF002_g21443 [Phytophthora fragariae]|uniref:FYVE-type domain-containing protein n=1 Tax=Phytophthora fragariae TaxID=53985 RepID=A0A6A3XLW6_9STRA|nr:hypothetical protein PF002_g21443 [Phytophthora fragariae]
MSPSKNGITMPTLELERHDEKMMQELAATLLQQNLDQYSSLAVTPDGHPDSRSWVSIQKREGIRVYKESTRQQQQQLRSQAATGNGSVKTAKVPPSLLLMGTIKGHLDDVLYASAASTTEAMLTKSKFIDDGAVDCKVLARIVEPTMADPMHFLNVTWRCFALSEPRDYVCLDVAGWGHTARGEHVAYHLIHSVGFDALPNFEHKGVARTNMSVCWIFRQRTASLVECYARGFYEFDTTNAMLNSMSLHAIASQWLSCVKLVAEFGGEHASINDLRYLLDRAIALWRQVCGESVLHTQERDRLQSSTTMSKDDLMAQSLPRLQLSSKDMKAILELSVSLLETNLTQQKELRLTRDGFPDSRVWREMQRKEGVRVFKEFQSPNSMPSGNSATCMRAGIAHPEQSGMPSLLMLGTVAGSLNDVMYASIPTSTDSMRARSKFVQDGVVNSKVLCCVESPSADDPFHTLNVTWRYYSLSEPRDYTCIEATGLLPNDYGELVGFHLVHSLEFAQLPVFRNYGVERANMSVCTFFRQKTSTLVECYTRGYFDFHSSNDMLNNISLHTISTQWLSMARYVECAQMKKLVWWMRVRTGRDSFASSSQSSSSTSSGGIAGIRQHARPRVQAGTRCRVCNRGFGGFLRTTPRACACCAEWVCKRCCVKKQMCVVSSHNKSKVNDKKLVFCAQCIAEGSKSDAALILREELLGHRSSYSSTRRTTMETMETLDD